MSGRATLRQMEILLALRDAGSVSAAAERLHLTQPTVSMQLKKLSETLEADLYHQVGRRLQFTDAGERALETAIEVLASFERMEMDLADLKGLKRGTLRLGVVTTAKYFIPHLLGGFCERYPQIEIEFKVGNRQQVIDRLSEGRDDFYVFSHPPKDAPLALHEFLDNPLVAIASADHPWAKRRTVPLQEFAQEPFLIREHGSGTRYALERFLREQNAKLNVRMTVESNEAIRHSVMSGLGVSVISTHTLAFGGDSGLAILPVEGMPIRSHWYLAHHKAKSLSPVAATFLDWISQKDNLQIEA
ncbi:LysR family transcriptional regulator [Ferrimonas balearica]|uniref:LysR family transcriptional regulator n=1 Tax=Ferrimonas balearica TaxID=44012 RepID=UPI001C58DEA3|nr:LysR family transcriptional regulator [Ferrimonas balearica]MBW3163219.1 LysR family transcriptional regulator [Ferrimonas balearica]MBY5980910.1 LysR family transcriptional regulator [Ferrimonas balearica]MBY6016767.1 LysR family transcriptional regulator [Halomonas denitrificans]MBY6094940.1 LysR family transcriptional regulator [Ferrimonas balearica]